MWREGKTQDAWVPRPYLLSGESKAKLSRHAAAVERIPLFGDHRFGRVFFYHNGAESYYSSRGFRSLLRV
jgi:hypothetical protein